jgi:hypothetical protein
MMNWVVLINVFFIFFSLKIAASYETWSPPWWLNIFASAFNAALVLWIVTT